jgi:hypothetical protein
MKTNLKYLILVPRIILMDQLKKEIIKHNSKMKTKIQLIGDSNNTFDENKLITICVFNSVHLIENYCMNESGVRNLKRCMEIIHTKLNLFRLMKPDNNLFGKDLSLNVSFPFRVSIDIVDKLIKRDENTNIYKHMYI